MKNDLEKGFYYHYKHNPNGEVNNYAYEVSNIGHHTEVPQSENAGLDESAMVVYRPLYENALVYKIGKHWDIRPYKMFTESVTKEGKTFPRFKKIEDESTIAKLKAIRDSMYEA